MSCHTCDVQLYLKGYYYLIFSCRKLVVHERKPIDFSLQPWRLRETKNSGMRRSNTAMEAFRYDKSNTEI